jgi:hypothetical protein
VKRFKSVIPLVSKVGRFIARVSFKCSSERMVNEGIASAVR